VMGASFRNTTQIVALAGCDLLTINPDLLKQLAASDAPLQPVLTPHMAHAATLDQLTLDEKSFRLMQNDDAMATEKLAEGIRSFCVDTVRLEQLINRHDGR
jgi:transaldolase